jgi:hypothetical protein
MDSVDHMGMSVVQHDDTDSDHAGFLSLDGSTEVLEVSTVALCFDGEVRLVAFLLIACWSCVDGFFNWNVSTYVCHNVSICYNIPVLLHHFWTTVEAICTMTCSPVADHIC